LTVGKIYTTACPKNCLDTKHIVYGDGLYSADSSVCQAAIHAGYIGNKGGEVKFVVLDENNNYVGSRKNGIES